MGFFDFIKKVFAAETPIEENKEAITIENLSSKLDELESNSQEQVKRVSLDVKNRIHQLILDLKNSLQILKTLTIQDKKEHEKIKLLVKQNLDLYAKYLEKLIETLEESSTDYMNINQFLENFKNSSRNSYEKATILIGKELGAAKEKIKEFQLWFQQILEENKDSLEKESNILKLRKKLEDINYLNSIKSELVYYKSNLEENKQALEKEKKTKQEEAEKTRETEEFKRFEQGAKIKQRDENLLEQEILAIKQEINLKEMLKFFHKDEKISRLLESYMENFRANMKEEHFQSLIKEFNPNFNLDKLKKIIEKSIILEVKFENEIEKKVMNKESEIKKLMFEIENISQDYKEYDEKQMKIEEKISKINEEIENSLKMLFPNTVDIS
jgi:hypothetical protein